MQVAIQLLSKKWYLGDDIVYFVLMDAYVELVIMFFVFFMKTPTYL